MGYNEIFQYMYVVYRYQIGISSPQIFLCIVNI
jgi:hypothetical protein